MLLRSIPQYEVMREAVFELGSKFVQPRGEGIGLDGPTGRTVRRAASRDEGAKRLHHRANRAEAPGIGRGARARDGPLERRPAPRRRLPPHRVLLAMAELRRLDRG